MGKIAQRRELGECISEFVPPGGSIGLGGLHFHNMPMALVRELIRQEVEIAHLMPGLDGSFSGDQLIGAGLVAEVQVGYLGLEFYGLAPRFRAAAESGRIRVRDCDEGGLALAIKAGAAGQPFAPLPAGFFPTDPELPTVPSVNPEDYREVTDPFTGEIHTVVRAVSPDVALIHCQAVDRWGNCGFYGGEFLDLELAKAARVCLVQAERQFEELPPECRATLPGYVVDAYCVVPGGAHPGSSHGVHRHDDAALRRYAEMAVSDNGFAEYRELTIAASEAGYRAAAGLPGRAEELIAGPVG